MRALQLLSLRLLRHSYTFNSELPFELIRLSILLKFLLLLFILGKKREKLSEILSR